MHPLNIKRHPARQAEIHLHAKALTQAEQRRQAWHALPAEEKRRHQRDQHINSVLGAAVRDLLTRNLRVLMQTAVGFSDVGIKLNPATNPIPFVLQVPVDQPQLVEWIRKQAAVELFAPNGEHMTVTF